MASKDSVNSPCPADLYPDCPFKIHGEESVFEGESERNFEGDWIGARAVKFLDPNTGTDGVWECAYRKTKPPGVAVDGVDVIAILKKKNAQGREEKALILVKQYRIPIRGWSLEFPAGLMETESIEAAAIREMKEETGYSVSGVLRKATEGELMLDPGLSNDSVSFVVVEVEGDDPVNADPQQDLQHGEHIDVVLVPFRGITKALDAFIKGSFVNFVSFY